VCNGAGDVLFCHKVVKEANRLYIRHLVQKIREYADKGVQEDLVKACAIDALLLVSLRHAFEQNPRRDTDLFSEEIRVAFGDARVALGQKSRQYDKERRQEGLKDVSDYLEAIRLMRLRNQTMTDSPKEYWHGLGYGWDRP